MAQYVAGTLTADASAVAAVLDSGGDDSVALGNGFLTLFTTLKPGVGMRAARVAGEATIDFTRFALAQEGSDPRPRAWDQSLNVMNGVFTARYGDDGWLTSETFVLRSGARAAAQKIQADAATVLRHAPAPPQGFRVETSDQVLLSIAGAPVTALRIRGDAASGARAAYYGVYYNSAGAEFEGLTGQSVGPETVVRLDAGGHVNVLHVVAHGKDADAEAIAEATAILTHANLSASKIKSDHTLAWSALWRPRITITPKAGASVADATARIRLATYRVLLSVTDRFGPLAPGAARIGSDAVAVLCALYPSLACRLALQELAGQLDQSRTSGPLPDLMSLGRAAWSAWSAYRASVDRCWLREAAHLLYEAAKTVVSAAERSGYDAETGVVDYGVLGATRVGPDVVSQHGATIYAALRTLTAAAQTAYELKEVACGLWVTASEALKVPRDALVLRYSESQATGATRDHVTSLHPFYFTQIDDRDPGATLDANAPLADAVAGYEGEREANASVALAATLAARAADSEAAIDAAYTRLFERANDRSPLWGFIDGDDEQGLDVRESAGFLAALLYGVLRLRVRGTVDRSSVHTVRMGVYSEPFAHLPTDWSAVDVPYVEPGTGAVVHRLVNNICVCD